MRQRGGAGPVKPPFGKPCGQQVGKLHIVPLCKEGVGVAPDAQLGQVYDCGVAAVAVDAWGKKGAPFRAGPSSCPLPPIVAWLVGDIAAVADDDGDAGQLFEIGGRYGVLAVSAPNGLMVCIAWGVSPSGKTNPLPGS